MSPEIRPVRTTFPYFSWRLLMNLYCFPRAAIQTMGNLETLKYAGPG